MTIATKINDVIALSKETASEPGKVDPAELHRVFGGELEDWTTPLLDAHAELVFEQAGGRER